MALAIQLPVPDPKKILKWILIGALLVVIFILGRNSKLDFEPPKQTDTSKIQKKNDSLVAENKDLKVREIKLLTRLDSVISVKAINHIKTKRDVEKIKKFTPTDIHKWNDSTLRANGLK